MAHFPVLVVGNVEDQLDSFAPNPLLDLPDEPDRWPLKSWRTEYERALADLEQTPSDEVDDPDDVAEVLTYWLGSDVEQVGPEEYIIEQETNPDARFDYYTEGGRFADALLRHDGKWVNCAPKRDIDFDGMRRNAREQAETVFAEFTTAVSGLERPLPWSEWLTQRTGNPSWNAALREDYTAIPWVAAAAPFDVAMLDVQKVFCLDAPDPRAAYVEQRVRSAGVCEVLVLDETWHSRDDHGDDVWARSRRAGRPLSGSCSTVSPARRS
ncbi:hypothetical protein [Nocardia macrotermitis]|uniref:Uncharacterized protein n=1 Tax=Nocardia macrotermitis TaxID=2585198 RepID=A0A7K0D8F9_9NOCA|nr:hypothetical protein [Nocardia macrotermitis]MQY22075.1 hypothetical protein [Nocardia macrotermitis]